MISVIMPCFNAEAYIEEALESVFNQTYKNIQLLIVDDGSTDRTSLILARYRRYLTLINQANLGPYRARNRGIVAAKGEFIAFLDSDDYWREDCLERLHDQLVQNDAVLAYCGWQNVGMTGGRGRPYIPPDYEQMDKAEAFLQSCPWPIHASLTRQTVFREVGGFPNRWSTSEDYYLWLNLATSRKIVRVEEVLAFYRHHNNRRVTGNRWIVARNHWLIQRDFVDNHKEQVAHLDRGKLNQLIDGNLLLKAYESYWERDLDSARKIFRLALRTRAWKLKDVKYMLPCLLPYRWHAALVEAADRVHPVRT